MEMDLEKLRALAPEGITEAHIDRGEAVAVVALSQLHPVLKALKETPEWDFDFLMDVVAVDFLGRVPRFELVYLLYSLRRQHRLRVKVRLSDGESVPTAIDLWKSADWAEREVWDMMGIRFVGHPNMKRILMFEGFEGHPLRKDYPIDRRQPIPRTEKIP